MAPTRRTALLLDGWALLLAAVLCAPVLWTAGLGVSADLVFSPRQPLTADVVGLGERVPRAVPLDAVVGLLGLAVPGEVLFRVGLLAGLVLAGAGAHRLLADVVDGVGAVGRAVAVTAAVWNPFVVERLAIGQWALLLGCGALYFVVREAVRVRGGEPPWRLLLWVALCSLTPTGGLLAVVTATVLCWHRHPRSWVAPVVGSLVLQLPWVLPSLLVAGAGGSGGGGLELFGARPEAPGGTLVSLVGLGGIWDRLSVPTSRTLVLGTAAGLLAVVVVVAAARRLGPCWPRLPVVAGAGLVLAAAPALPGVEQLVGVVVDHVPGGGLLRDSQKWVAPWAVLVAVSAGAAADRLVARARRVDAALGLTGAVLVVATPVVLLPDATAATWDTVRPVRYPQDYAAVAALLERADDERVALLPLASYRQLAWAGERAAYDPAYSWWDARLVGSDVLVTGRGTAGDDSAAVDDLEAALATPDPAGALAAAGFGWVVVQSREEAATDLPLDGLHLAYGGPDLQLWEVPGAVAAPPSRPVWQWVLVLGADGAVLVSCGACAFIVVRRRRTASMR